MTYAFLFDIDGCLTLPDHYQSILDVELIDRIIDLSSPIAFVTGRSDGWLKQHYKTQNRLNYLKIPTYIEFGLVLLHRCTLEFQQSGTDFLPIRDRYIDLLKQEAEDENIYFETDRWYDDYPSHGSIWVEQKHIQLSIAANSDVSTEQLHDLVRSAWKEKNSARVLFHHLGVDVIPKQWSKARATEHFIRDLEEEQYDWYVFGDNESDREMVKGLSSVTFVSTTKTASTQVRSTLQELDVIG